MNFAFAAAQGLPPEINWTPDMNYTPSDNISTNFIPPNITSPNVTPLDLDLGRFNDTYQIFVPNITVPIENLSEILGGNESNNFNESENFIISSESIEVNISKESFENQPAQVVTETGSEKQKTSQVKSSIITPIISLIILIAAIAAIYFAIKFLIKFLKKRKLAEKTVVVYDGLAPIVNYIKDALSKGFSKDEIKRVLMEQGWPVEKINQAFSLAQ